MHDHDVTMGTMPLWRCFIAVTVVMRGGRCGRLQSMCRIAFSFFVTLFVTASASANPKPEETWPGFRGHGMTGIAPGYRTPERWSTTENVRWKAAVPGQGWSSPIVWGDTVFLTSGISSKPFKQPTPGLYGNDYIAELQAQGLSDEEVMRRVRGRDNESPEESDEIRYMVYALDAATGKIKWEREAYQGTPSGGRHRKNTYASETPFTDGERLYVSFGQNVGLFCYTLDGTLLWKKHWPPQPIYLDFGTASSPIVHDGRVYLLHDSEASRPTSPRSTPRPARKSGARRGRGTGLPQLVVDDAVVWKNEKRTEIVTLGHAMVISYGLDGKELWRVTGMSMPTASPFASDGWLYVGSGSQGDANRPFLAIKPGASGDITLTDGATSNDFMPGAPARLRLHAVRARPRRPRVSRARHRHPRRARREHGQRIYKVRVGGGGHTFSASPVAAGIACIC